MTTTTRPRRAVAYARVSRVGKGTGGESKSIDEQFAVMRAQAVRDGWQIVAERSDEVSASRYSTKARPGWAEVMEIIRSGTVDTLSTWEISRASRDRHVYAALIAACVEADVSIAIDGRVHNPADPDDGFMLDLGGALAVRESSMTSKRNERNVKARAHMGRPHGSMPYGYRRVIDLNEGPNLGKTIGREKHPEQAPIVAEICRRLLAHEPADAIAADLNRRGLLTATGKQWRGGNLSKLALRPTYAGIRVYLGAVLDDVTCTWPEIISKADHYALTEMFGAPERDKWRNPTHVKHLGSGLFRCGREGCDGTMRVAVEINRPNRYDCKTCHKISRHQEPVDELIEAVAIVRLKTSDVLDGFGGAVDVAARAAGEEAARLRGKIREARDAWNADRLSLESFTAMEAATLPKIKDAERRARPREVPAVLVEAAGPRAAQWWADASIGARRTIVDLLMTVTILPVGRGGRPFDRSTVEIVAR